MRSFNGTDEGDARRHPAIGKRTGPAVHRHRYILQDRQVVLPPVPGHHRTNPSPMFGFCRHSCVPLIEAPSRVRALGRGSDPSLLLNTHAISGDRDGVYPRCSGVAAHGVGAA